MKAEHKTLTLTLSHAEIVLLEEEFKRLRFGKNVPDFWKLYPHTTTFMETIVGAKNNPAWQANVELK